MLDHICLEKIMVVHKYLIHPVFMPSLIVCTPNSESHVYHYFIATAINDASYDGDSVAK